MMLRTFSTTDMSYWQISFPLLLMGLGLPFYFVPLTALALLAWTGIACFISALVIWLAPRPTRAVDMSHAGH
jgi:hypothetical protein